MTQPSVPIYHQLDSFLPGIIYCCKLDAEPVIIELAGAVEDIWGWSKSALINNECLFKNIIHIDDIALVCSEFNRVIKAGSTFEIEHRLVAANGNCRWVWNVGRGYSDGYVRGFMSCRLSGLGRHARLMDAHQRVVEVASSGAVSIGDCDTVAQNICKTCAHWLEVERVSIWLLNAEQTKIESVCLYLRTSDTYAAGMVLRSSDYPDYFKALISGRAIDAVDAISDARTREFSGGYLESLNIHSMLDSVIRNGEEIIGIICCEHTKNQRVWGLDDINFVAELGDQYAQAVVNQRRLQATEQAAKARAANEAKNKFLATVSHELRTPLNGVLGMAELLSSTNLDARQQEIISTLTQSGELLLAVINNVLDYSKIEAGKMDIDLSPVDFSVLVQQSVAMFARQTSEQSVRITVDFPNNMPTIWIDKLRIQQVLVNFLANAVKFTSQGDVRVSGAVENSMLIFHVEDTGIGMSDELKARLFQPFEQAVGRNGEVRPAGTGLGLSIARGLVEAMDGQISVDSQLGKGSRFSVRLPLSKVCDYSPAENLPPVQLNHIGLPGEKKEIWVAEDNIVNQKVINGLLKKEGLIVSVFDHGADLLHALKVTEKLPAMILMDCEMPVMDGLDAVRAIRADVDLSKLPVIALTAHAFSDYQEIAETAGMDDYLTKPVKVTELRRVISKYINAKH